ncbi:Deacetylase [subsurface metagenome]
MLIFDTLLKGGTIIDPSEGICQKSDLGIIKPNIAGIIQPNDSSVSYRECIDASGLIIVPGLIDFHSHIFRGGMEIAVDPLELIPLGITATVDGGSVGYPSFSYFRQEVIMKTPVIINAVINLSRIGLLMLDESEFIQPGFINESELAQTIEVHKDVVLGIKIRFSKEQVGDSEEGLKILQRAKKIARDLNLRLFVHATNPPIIFPRLLENLDEGDVLLHMYHGRGFTLLNSRGEVWREAWEARKRGVIFDCAHGMSHFNFRVARKAIEQGFLPDTISSDMTSLGLSKPGFCGLTTVISELIALGMKFKDILLCCSKNPSRLMKGVISGIRIGNPANLTVLRMENAKVRFTDSEGQRIEGHTLIVPEMTFIQGELLYQRNKKKTIEQK